MRFRLRKFPSPPESAPVVIFTCDRFLSLPFGLTVVLVRFTRFHDGKKFITRVHVSKFLGTLESSPIEIFERNCFPSSSFGLIVVLV